MSIPIAYQHVAWMDVQRKRLLYRAQHMGSVENDTIFGRFAEEMLPLMSKEQLDRFERLLEADDTDLFHWATGAAPPFEHDHDVMDMLRTFVAGRRSAGRD
jgi:antitoxin CptB